MGAGLSGKRARLYYDDGWTDGSDPGTPTWSLIKPTVDLAFAGTKGEADVSSRESDWMLRDGALKDGSITFGYRPRKGADSIYDKLIDSWQNDTPVLVSIWDQDESIVGAKGWQMVIVVFELNEDYPHTDGALVNVSMSPFPGVDASGNIIEPTRVANAGP